MDAEVPRPDGRESAVCPPPGAEESAVLGPSFRSGPDAATRHCASASAEARTSSLSTAAPAGAEAEYPAQLSVASAWLVPVAAGGAKDPGRTAIPLLEGLNSIGRGSVTSLNAGPSHSGEPQEANGEAGTATQRAESCGAMAGRNALSRRHAELFLDLAHRACSVLPVTASASLRSPPSCFSYWCASTSFWKTSTSHNLSKILDLSETLHRRVCFNGRVEACSLTAAVCICVYRPGAGGKEPCGSRRMEA